MKNLSRIVARNLFSSMNLAITVQSILPHSRENYWPFYYKFSHTSEYTKDMHHCLPAAKRTKFKIFLLFGRTASTCITELCVPVSSQPGWQRLRSAVCGDMQRPSFTHQFQPIKLSYVLGFIFGPFCQCAYVLLHSTRFSKRVKTVLEYTLQLESHACSTFLSYLK